MMQNTDSNLSNAKNKFGNSRAVTDQNVLIVGGGHVGLSFALLLAHHGIASTLLEKMGYPTISPNDDSNRSHYLDSRNTALSRRTVQIYQEIGLWDELQSHACRIDAVQISEQGSFGRAQLNKDEEKVESFGQVMENAWLGRKLLLAAQQEPLIALIDHANVTAVAQQNDMVTLSFSYYGKEEHEQQLQASVLVACDGRDSTVRQLLNIGTTTYDYQQTAIVGVVETDKPHGHVAIERFSPAGPLAVLPLTDPDGDGNDEYQTGYRRSVVWVCPTGEENKYLEDDAHFLATLQKAFGERAGTFVTAGRRGAYPLTRVLADKQVDGRCVVMGNAAHTLHPVAGQGFNLCMRDAHVLAQMMSTQVLKGADIGDTQLLKRYEKARQTDQKRVIRFCDAVVHGFTHPNPAIKLARNVALVAFDKLPNIKPLIANYAMGLKS
ncbi:UbiH/UbiF/VisC/COQ6 family ubiquinone biosynthesis hydroxylase [Psychrobacter sp. N25K4-3-2]|uniref:UbiH/UbiF/VisC/COQ6 family ubiquinone biosynthesis hydroxylase n=1 Tax=Psychrobacter sp. N25K4-3-2 TaxID=2785026 RepID=UPI00188A8953|nr:UbiH/UbiF/VisC/COQ6 family ubiquinone biosynthesis hydroxylase [Psychrobacter sp. N25K4-3-2]MBF4489769.1 UbiH/UbiF/VisC/COQ6 family ubiquinone biosynthesis hydroxylase [Psychrobacter sp. N25K4-3-2]